MDDLFCDKSVWNAERLKDPDVSRNFNHTTWYISFIRNLVIFWWQVLTLKCKCMFLKCKCMFICQEEKKCYYLELLYWIHWSRSHQLYLSLLSIGQLNFNGWTWRDSFKVLTKSRKRKLCFEAGNIEENFNQSMKLFFFNLALVSMQHGPSTKPWLKTVRLPVLLEWSTVTVTRYVAWPVRLISGRSNARKKSQGLDAHVLMGRSMMRRLVIC